MEEKLVEGHHDYDGIQEYDNPLPDWFLYLFYGCIVFAFLYFAFYMGHASGVARTAGVGFNLGSSGAMLAAAQRSADREGAGTESQELHGEQLLALLKTPGSISQGEAVFKANCVACHGGSGQGVVGPNLTDAYWLHGGRPDSVVESIAHGYPAKGMPAWKAVLGPQKVRMAAAYVISLKGMPVTGGKEPQGAIEP